MVAQEGGAAAVFAGDMTSAADTEAMVTAAIDAFGSVDVLGFSNGGSVAMRLAMRHPALVRRQIVASSQFRRDGMIDGFWDGLSRATLADMPDVYQQADLATIDSANSAAKTAASR